jgi:murein L,D-transpeptidase YcbB/YkuD
MKNIPLLLLSLFLLGFYSCKSKEKELEFLDKKIKIEEKIKWVLKDENIHLLETDEETQNFLKEFYKKRKYKSLWSNDTLLSENGKEIYKIFKKPICISLPTKRLYIKTNDSTNLVFKELEISENLASIKNDLNVGFFDTVSKQFTKRTYSSQNEELVKLSKIKDKNKIGYELISWGPKDTIYQNLARNLFDFAFNADFNDENLKIKVLKNDSLKLNEQVKKALFQKKFLKLNETDSASFVLALKKFQVENGLRDDAVIGKMTCEALNETNLEKCQRAALVLEKLRKQKILDPRYIIINIPEYTLRFYADDTLKSVNRVVVGKFDTKTPEFSSNVSKIVAFPYWNVPFSITSKEILPDAKRNPGYFERNNMKIYKKGEEIDPLTVNWKSIREKTFPYKAVQQPGYHNSLGIIKFEFANKYGVYVHDTPSKSLFNTVIRSYSHGCVRCEKPIDLAKTILLKDENKVIPDSLDSIMTRRQNHPISLKKKIPIYLVYQSVISRNKQLIFLQDIYHKDKRLAKLMFA